MPPFFSIYCSTKIYLLSGHIYNLNGFINTGYAIKMWLHNTCLRLSTDKSKGQDKSIFHISSL